jgi:hypothetical protein
MATAFRTTLYLSASEYKKTVNTTFCVSSPHLFAAAFLSKCHGLELFWVRMMKQKIVNVAWLVRREWAQCMTATYTVLLTPWSSALHEKLTSPELVKKFPAFYGTRRFINEFTSYCRHLSLSWTTAIQSICLPNPLLEDPGLYHPPIWATVQVVSFHHVSPPKPWRTSPVLNTCHMPRPSHSSWFDHPKNI